MQWLATAVIAALALPIATWYGLYRFVGYGTATLLAAQLAILVVAAALVTLSPLRWSRLGLGRLQLRDAILVGTVAYGAVIAAGATMNALGADLTLWRSSYALWAFVDNWLVTAFGEELLHAGVLYALVRACLRRRGAWAAVPIVAAVFALGHLPGYLAIGHEGGALFGRLGLNLVSWLIFGTVFALSRNLWLTVLAHAATDYGVSPLVTDEPSLGLLFMTVVLGGAWLLRSHRGNAPRPERHNPTMTTAAIGTSAPAEPRPRSTPPRPTTTASCRTSSRRTLCSTRPAGNAAPTACVPRTVGASACSSRPRRTPSARTSRHSSRSGGR